MAKPSSSRRAPVRIRRFTLDESLIALFIAAMQANGHVAPDEAERAEHLIWSTRRFRRKSGDSVARLIHDMRRLAGEEDTGVLIERATRVIPARMRPSAFAVVADLLLADGRLEASERRFLQKLGHALKLDAAAAKRIVDVVALKNKL